jgi:restriction system protein
MLRFAPSSKHFAGWIFGKSQDSQWTQVLYKKKSKFLNPIREIFGHVKALQDLFNLPEDNFVPVVVFTGNAEFKTDPDPGVVKLADLMRLLSSERPAIFDERKMAYVVGRIEVKRLRRSIETKEYHMNFVRRRIHARETARA